MPFRYSRVVAVVVCLVRCLGYLEFVFRQIATARDWERKGFTVVFSFGTYLRFHTEDMLATLVDCTLSPSGST